MENQRITVAEYAERLLGCPGPKLDLDNLIEKLRPSTGGWESGVLEFKATYLPNPSHPDPDDKYPDKFRWNVFEAMLGMANANGGCVVVGIAEKTDHTGIEPGCYDPAGIVTVKQKEDKDLVENFISELFAYKKAEELKFSFLEKEGKDGKDEAVSHYGIASKDVDRLKALVTPYVCRSEKCACNAIAVIVRPISKGSDLIPVKKKRREKEWRVCYYRDPQNARNLKCDDVSKLADYQVHRDPYDNNYRQLLRLDSQCELSRPHCGLSNVPLPSPSFKGRSAELESIRKVCKKGMIPHVWATGGVGKTQLLLKYAQEYADEYPGGRFFLQLDGVRSWDGLLEKLVDPKVTPKAMEIRSWFGLRKYVPQKTKDGEENTRNMVLAPLESQEIVDKIDRKCDLVGPVLLVLDNIDEPKDLLSDDALAKIFPLGRPKGLDIIASARTGITPSRALNVESIQLPDLPEDVAIALLCGGAIDERDSAKKMLLTLGYRALYLQTAAYKIDDAREDGYPNPVKKVLDDLKDDPSRAMGFKGDDPQAPGVLWRKWALPLIQNKADGEKIEKLVRAIAFYLPTGVPVRILEGLWYSDFGEITGRKVLDAMEDENKSFSRVKKVFERCGFIPWDDAVNGRVMMHRLFQDAIRKDSEQESGEWIARIGKALASNPCMAPADWVELLSADGTWLEFCPWGDLNGREYAEILSANPDVASKIPDWSRISPAGWAMMLRKTKRFDDDDRLKCRFAMLNPADVLEKRPELESRFDFSKLRGWQWSDLIRKVPKFAEKCPFDRFSEGDWEGFIVHDPRLSEIDEIISRNRGVKALESLLQKKTGLVERRSDEQDQIEKHAHPFAIQCGVPDSQELSLNYLKRCKHLSAFVLREWPQLRPFVDMKELRDPKNGNYCLWLLSERPCFVDDVIWNEVADEDCRYVLLPMNLSESHVSRAVDEKLIDRYSDDPFVMRMMLEWYPEYAEAQELKKRLPGQWIDVLMGQMRYEEFRMQFKWEGLSENDWHEIFMGFPRSSVSTRLGPLPFNSKALNAVLATHSIPTRIKRIGEELMTLNDGLPEEVEYRLRELGTADANVVLRLPCTPEEGLLVLTVYLDSYPEKCPKLVLSRKPAHVSGPDDFLPPWAFGWTWELSQPDRHTLSLRYEGNWWSPDVTVLQIYQDVSDWLATKPRCIGNGESVEIRHAGNAVAK